MSTPPRIQDVLREQLAYLDEQPRLPTEVLAAFQVVLDAVEANIAAVEPLGAAQHDALVALEQTRVAVLTLRSRYMPNAERQTYVTVPETMPLWKVARLVYGDATKVDLLYKANVVRDAAAVPAGTVLVVLPKE